MISADGTNWVSQIPPPLGRTERVVAASDVPPRLHAGDGTSRRLTSWFRRGIAVGAVVVLLTGCSSTSGDDEATPQALAEQLVSATQAAGVAPNLTVDVAEALYGSAAPAICDVFDGGLSSAAETLILGNPFQGRRKSITTAAVTYGRLVVETYCPDVLDDYNEVVNGLDPIESTT